MKTVTHKPFAGFTRPDGVIVSERPSGPDTAARPGADEKSAPSVYWIDDLVTR